jgi:hypothetical protein
MAERTAQKRKAVGFTAANGRTPKASEVSHVPTFERPDLLILLGFAFGKPQESISEFEVALRLKPDLKGAADNLRRAEAQLSSQR